MNDQHDQPSSDDSASDKRSLLGILLTPFGTLLSALFWLGLFALGSFLAVVIFATWPICMIVDKRKAMLHWYCTSWANIMIRPLCWVGLLGVKVKGREHLPPGAGVIVANHQSQLDILIAFLTWAEFKWVSKASIFKIPMIGWGMAVSGYIGLKRGDSASVKQMMKDCLKAMEKGSRVALFPEGTRSQDGKLQSFKPGPFVIASKGKVPVIPLVIRGTAAALPKHGWRFRWGSKMELEFLPAISAEEVKELGSKGVMAKCEAMIRDAL